MKEYKVVNVLGEMLGGAVPAARLESELNKHTRQGWNLVQALPQAPFGNQNTVLLIFSREM